MAHTIEEAKSGRAGCRTCKKPIPKGELRFGEEVENSFGEPGETTYRWHHIVCAASSKPDELKATLEADVGALVPSEQRPELDRLIAEADAKKPPPYPHADKAPTGRARCQACQENIPKGQLRVAFEREIDRGMGLQKAAGYLHPKCAAAYMEEQGSTHAVLTDALRANTRDLSEAELEQLFAEV